MCILIVIIDESVINSMEVECFADCSSHSPDASNDESTNDFNGCCNTVATTGGYGGDTITCTAACK